MDADSRGTPSSLRAKEENPRGNAGKCPLWQRARTHPNVALRGTQIAPMHSFLADSFAACTKRHSGSAALEVLGETFMAWLVRTLRLPAAESHTNLALALCVFLMGLLSVALIWQAQIIANQRDAIRFLETLKFGS